MTPEIRTRLLASIDAGRLVVLCGAGLSMAPPSNLPSARRVAEMCFDVYALKVDPLINPALREDLEALAEHFTALNTLKSQFIENLVPWGEFERQPNPGHAAMADFLVTKALVAALSSNYDKLIERCGWDYGADFRGSLDGDEATVCARNQSPLLKFHGCSHRDRANTVWAPSQLHDGTVAERIEKSKIWMAANLRQKDLLVVGFWSDWGYLNQTIGAALHGLDPLSVTVIDPFDTVQLQQKAPELWALAHQANVTFTHVQESGADALDELRRAFSESYLRQVLASGKAALEAEIGSACDPNWLNVAGLDSESLYSWRRDAEGVPVGRPAVTNRPRTDETLGYFHLLLRRAGAVQGQAGYTYSGRQIRVINGAGSFLSSVAARFVEPPSVPAAELCIAVGASDLGLPGNVLRAGAAGSVVRPAATGKVADSGAGARGAGGLMDIATQAEIILRGAGYETWPWTGASPPVTCFENGALIGFVHVFTSGDELLARWEAAQSTALSRHSTALRAAGAKAWNVYSVFLAKEQGQSQQRLVERIEEDFALTRKIARAGLRTVDDVERALLPLTRLMAQPILSESDFEDRLRARLKDVSADVMTAFLGATSAEDVAKMLAEKI